MDNEWVCVMFKSSYIIVVVYLHLKNGVDGTVRNICLFFCAHFSQSIIFHRKDMNQKSHGFKSIYLQNGRLSVEFNLNNRQSVAIIDKHLTWPLLLNSLCVINQIKIWVIVWRHKKSMQKNWIYILMGFKMTGPLKLIIELNK